MCTVQGVHRVFSCVSFDKHCQCIASQYWCMEPWPARSWPGSMYGTGRASMNAATAYCDKVARTRALLPLCRSALVLSSRKGGSMRWGIPPPSCIKANRATAHATGATRGKRLQLVCANQCCSSGRSTNLTMAAGRNAQVRRAKWAVVHPAVQMIDWYHLVSIRGRLSVAHVVLAVCCRAATPELHGVSTLAQLQAPKSRLPCVPR